MKCTSRSLKPRRARRGAHRVRGLLREQRLIAGHEVGAQQALRELGGERVGGELQSVTGAADRLKNPGLIINHIGPEVAPARRGRYPVALTVERT